MSTLDIAFLVVAGVVGLIISYFTIPDLINHAYSHEIKVPVRFVHYVVINTRAWPFWSPFSAPDSNEDADEKGHALDASTEGEVHFTIMPAEAPGEVPRMKLEYTGRVRCPFVLFLTVKSLGENQTEVIWTIEGDLGFQARLAKLVRDPKTYWARKLAWSLLRLEQIAKVQATVPG